MRRRATLAGLSLLLSAGGVRAQDVRGDFPFVRDRGTTVITGPIDQRFFGTFCQLEPKQFCKSIPILPDPCVTLRDMSVHVDHLTMNDGGFLQGAGQFVLDGKQGRLVVAGTVLERGRARIVAAAPGLGQEVGEATLSGGGLQVTVAVQGRSVVLRKDACGNHAPVVTLTAPFGPSFPFGQSVMLAGHIDDEDTDFPPERLVYTSNRQGLIDGTRIAGGRTLFTTALQPGPHHVTFTVTDSGGLTGQASIDLEILNRPPETPRIFLPAEHADLAAGAPVLLQGSAVDPDTGFLTGGALSWTAQLTPGGPFVPLGTGGELGTVFAAPADPVIIRLTATDGTGLQSQAERQVRVVPSTGNAPPVVVIQQPDRLQSNGPVAAIAFAGVPLHFLAAASDVESAGPDLHVRWEFVAIDAPGGSPVPGAPNPPPVSGTLAPDVALPVGPTGYYRVIFQATDAGGLTSSDSIEIFVSGAGIIL